MLVQHDGALPDGTAWRMRVPENWNGVLVNDLDYQARSDEPKYALLNQQGFATSGTARPPWRPQRYDNVRERDNQIAVIAAFTRRVSAPRAVIQYGHSGAGLVAEAMAEFNPDVVDGAVVAAGHDNVGLLGQYLDLMFVLGTLLGEGDLPVVHMPERAQAVAAGWVSLLRRAQQTPAGRAKIALAVTVAQFPSWGDPTSSRPTPRDPTSIQEAMYRTALTAVEFIVGTLFMFEHNAGGNPAGNGDVDYGSCFRNGDPEQRAIARELYDSSGERLGADLDRLGSAARIPADDQARDFYAVPGRTPSGKVNTPVLRVHEWGDAYVPACVMEGYEHQIRRHGREELYRQAVVDRAGHAAFTAAEFAVMISTLLGRIETHDWGDTSAASLNVRSAQLGAPTPEFAVRQPPRANRAVYLGD